MQLDEAVTGSLGGIVADLATEVGEYATPSPPAVPVPPGDGLARGVMAFGGWSTRAPEAVVRSTVVSAPVWKSFTGKGKVNEGPE